MRGMTFGQKGLHLKALCVKVSLVLQRIEKAIPRQAEVVRFAMTISGCLIPWPRTQLNLHWRPTMKLPVLMYHDITVEGQPDDLTVSHVQLEKHLDYLSRNGYHSISLQQLSDHIRSGKSLPKKSLLITFDDGYQSNVSSLQPLLEKYNQRAAIFLVADFIDKSKAFTAKNYLSASTIQQANPNVLEFACHTFDHKNYNELSIEKTRADLQQMFARFNQLKIKVAPFFAYTYGAFPKTDPGKMKALFHVFDEFGIIAAFRIGNRINTLPLKNRFLIERIDIRGNDASWKFKWLLRLGRKIIL
jgi:peptidoglycan/xylan/chitin deacetylase (PgdA/CDA1 family)